MNTFSKPKLLGSLFLSIALLTVFGLSVAVAQEGEPSLSPSLQEIAEIRELLSQD
jgi:hypothetical protein